MLLQIKKEVAATCNFAFGTNALEYCTFFTLLLCKLQELILLDFLPSCYILDNQVLLPGKCFLPPTCPGTSFVKNICRTLISFETLRGITVNLRWDLLWYCSNV